MNEEKKSDKILDKISKIAVYVGISGFALMLLGGFIAVISDDEDSGPSHYLTKNMAEYCLKKLEPYNYYRYNECASEELVYNDESGRKTKGYVCTLEDKSGSTKYYFVYDYSEKKYRIHKYTQFDISSNRGRTIEIYDTCLDDYNNALIEENSKDNKR